MKLLHYGKNILFLDFETTGVFTKNYGNIDVVETALLLYKSYGTKNQTILEYEELYRPRVKMNPFAERLTGLTDDMLKDKATFQQRLSKLKKYVKRADIIVAHSAAIEVKALLQADVDLSHIAVFDTQAFATILFPEMPKPNLTTLASHFNIELPRAHRAMEDVKAMVEVYKHMTTEMWTTIPSKVRHRQKDFTYTVNKKED